MSTRTFGDLRTTTVNGAYAGVTTPARQFQLIGDRCTNCGSVKVYVDGIFKAT